MPTKKGTQNGTSTVAKTQVPKRATANKASAKNGSSVRSRTKTVRTRGANSAVNNHRNTRTTKQLQNEAALQTSFEAGRQAVLAQYEQPLSLNEKLVIGSIALAVLVVGVVIGAVL